MRRLHRKLWRISFVALVCALMVFGGVSPYVGAQEEDVVPNGIAPLSKRISLLSIPLASYPFIQRGNFSVVPTIRFQEVVEIKVQFEDRTTDEEGNSISGLNIREDFLPLTASAMTSGLALYKETAGSNEGFNFAVGDQNSDTPIDLKEPPTVETDPTNPGHFIVTFKPRTGTTRLNTLMDQSPDFYIVAQTSVDLLHGDTFEVSIPANGITINDLRNPLPDNTLFENRFPSEEFAEEVFPSPSPDISPSINRLFIDPAVFQGDIVSIVSTIDEINNSNRIDASSEPTTVLGIDFVGREDQQYFIKEVRINWLGLNLKAVGRLMANLTKQEYTGGRSAGLFAAAPAGIMEQLNFYPSFFYSPWFYNFPVDAETGELLLETRTVTIGGEATDITYPLTMPLDNFGIPRETFILGMDSVGDNPAHFTSYVPFGPRDPMKDELSPRLVTQDILENFIPDGLGGAFLYREVGGTRGKYDKGVDQLIKLDADQFEVIPFSISPDEVNEQGSPLRRLLTRMIPGAIGGTGGGSMLGKEVVPFLFGDDNLASSLMGVVEMPDPADRPPFGSLECYMDPDCFFFDLMINVLRPYLGLTEGQIRYLFEKTGENGRTNAEELFGFPIVQGFTFVMPVAQDNALSNLLAPTSRTGQNAGADIFFGIQTSDKLRNLDSFIPFIGAEDVIVGTNVTGFTQGATEGVRAVPSVASIGVGRQNTGNTYAMIGRPRPRFQFQDLTQPGEGLLASNDNILLDSSMESPPKAVVGIDAVDFGQNATLVINDHAIEPDTFDTFFTENVVFSEVQIDFLPGTQSIAFNPGIIGVIPTQLGVSLPLQRIVSSHPIAIYMDDDTPAGDFYDDDGDGLIDEEYYNLIDDDGDGLIDEDLGDLTSAGINGIYDSADRYIPHDKDNMGSTTSFEQAAYAFPPNDQTKYQDYITAIEPEDDPIELEEGDLLPLDYNEGTFFAELDLRALNFSSYSVPRQSIYPPQGGRPFGVTAGPPFDPPEYNQGAYSNSDPFSGLVDLVPAIRGGGADFENFPYFPDDLFVEDPASGDVIWLIDLQGDMPVLADPDGDVPRGFALSMANALRIPNPLRGFMRVGSVPMVIDVEGESTDSQNPQGDNILDPPIYTQFGFYVQAANDDGAIADYVGNVIDALQQAYDSARDTIEQFNEAVADAEEAAAEAEEPTEPEYPELPEPQELTVPNPYDTLGLADFLDGGNYDTNFQYQLQLPDENFGPLAGNDYFIVLRAAPEARVGETFKVRIRSGQRNAVLQTFDEQTGESTLIPAPDGGIAYHSYVETDFGAAPDSFRNVSKNQITTEEIVVQSRNVPPSIQFVSPGSGLNLASADFEFDIVFEANDPDNVAQIVLFVDTDSLDFDGSMIPGALLREGFDTTFTINLRDDIDDFDPTQEYFIYARIDDGVNPPVYTYADGPIQTISGVTEPSDPGTGTGGGGIVVTEDLPNPIDYIKLTNDGRMFSLGDAPSFDDLTGTEPIADMELTPTLSGVIAVQVNGQVIATGDLGVFRTKLQPNSELLFSPENTAYYDSASGQVIVDATESPIEIERVRDIEVDFGNGAIYILDGDGDMIFLGEANTSLHPIGTVLDLYRDMELTPAGDQMYFLTGNGMLTTAGGDAVSDWPGMVEGDIYRDMSLIVTGTTVSSVVVTDANGNITVSGSATQLESLQPPESIPEGTIRQVKLFPNTTDMVMLVEGSGKVHILTEQSDLDIPTDGLVFSDTPGIDDDRVVDVETASINLQSVVDVVRDILEGIQNENIDQIMAYADSTYKDRTGADAQGLRSSLMSFFSFYEVETYTESSNQNSFTLTTQGDTVNAQVQVDVSVYYPTIDYIIPDVEQGALAGELFATMLFQQRVPFDQTMRIREVSDGRGWGVTLYEIRDFGRQTNELINTQDVEYQDIVFLTKQTPNTRLGFYTPRSKGVDPIKTFFLDVNENDPIAPFNILAVFQEAFLNRDNAPPAFEFSLYTGQFLANVGFDTINFNFQRTSGGIMKLRGMNLRQILSENQNVQQIGGGTQLQECLTQLDGANLESPFGFTFDSRGPVATTCQSGGGVDFAMSGEGLQVLSPAGGIMMLPENTNIYSINPQQYIKNLNRALVRTNPYDPANVGTGGGGGVTDPGFSATIEAGRAYFVIARDGRHYGFIQVPAIEGGVDPLTLDPPVLTFDYRYEDSFILPPNF